MADIYCDSAATGANDGTSWTDAYTSIEAAAILAATAWDTVHISASATYSPAATLTMTGVGTSSNPAKVIGYNQTGKVNDGTQVVIDGGSSVNNGMVLGTGQDYFHISNLYFSNFTSEGFRGAATTDGCFMDNVSASGAIVGLAGFRFSVWNNCHSWGNSSHGWWNVDDRCKLIECSAYDNGGDGFLFNVSKGTMFVNFLCYDNTLNGVSLSGNSLVVGGAFFSNGGDGIDVSRADVTVTGARLLANGAYGITNTSTNLTVLSTYIPAGGESLANTSGPTNGTLYTMSSSLNLNDLVGTDADGGVVDSTTTPPNLNTASTATLYSSEVDMDGTNKAYKTAGLSPDANSAGGGVFIPRIRTHNV